MGGSMSLGVVHDVHYSTKGLEFAEALKTRDEVELTPPHVPISRKELNEKVQERERIRLRRIYGRRLSYWLAELEPLAVIAFGEAYLGWDSYENHLLYPTLAERPGKIKHELMVDLEALVLNENREVLDIELGGERWLVSGGMSYGDEPTDAYAGLNRLDQAGILDKSIKLRELLDADEYEQALRNGEVTR